MAWSVAGSRSASRRASSSSCSSCPTGIWSGALALSGSASVRSVRASAALDKLSGGTEEEKVGVNIIRRAVEEPCRQIANNAGWEGSIVLDKVRNSKGAFGFNASTEEFEDLIKAGIIDQTKVVRTALLNASSVAGLLLTTEATVAEKPDDKPAAGGPPPGMGGMGGMGGMM